MARVVIVGGGISGLALAYRLQQRVAALEIVVLEQQSRPGGKLWTERRDGFQVEVGPNGFLDTKPSTLALSRDLGLGDQLVVASEVAQRNRYLLLHGRLERLPNSSASLLRSGLLSWRGKLNLLLERFRGGQRETGDESIASFARRRAGSEVADVLADALVTGIYAGDPEQLSVRATFPRLVALEEEYGSIMKGIAASARRQRAEAAARGEPYQQPGRMWSFAEGLRLLAETLTAQLRTPPLLGVAARRLEAAPSPEAPHWIVHGEGQDRWPADVVVLTCPAYQQAAFLADLDPQLAGEISAIPYNSVAVVAMGYRRIDVPRPLDGFGFLAPQRSRADLLGAQWCSSIFPGRAPADAVLLRVLCGGWHRPDVVGWDDARLLASVRGELRKALNIVAHPIFHDIVRWERAIPQYFLGHLERVGRIEERTAGHAGLFLGGNSYRGVALNDCTEQATLLAENIARHLAGRAG